MRRREEYRGAYQMYVQTVKDSPPINWTEALSAPDIRLTEQVAGRKVPSARNGWLGSSKRGNTSFAVGVFQRVLLYIIAIYLRRKAESGILTKVAS